MFFLFISMLLLSFLIFILCFLSRMCIFVFLFGGTSLTKLRNRLTKDTLLYLILTTQWIHVRSFFMSSENAS